MQYRGGVQYREGYHDACGGYFEYCGDVQYHGGYHDKCGDILSTVGVFSTLGNIMSKVHSLSSGKGEMFLCPACHAFTPHVNPWKN